MAERLTYLENSDPADLSWYLGLDLGTTGISAVLLNAHRRCVYPLFCWEDQVGWQALQDNQPQAVAALAKQSARSRPTTMLARTPTTLEKQQRPRKVFRFPWHIQQGTEETVAIATTPLDFKPDLRVSLPYYSPTTQAWEPQFQRAGGVSLDQTIRDLAAVLKYWLGTQNSEEISVQAEGLSSEELNFALKSLKGTILGCPTSYPDSFRFNLREAVLEANLVADASHCLFVEDAIAVILSELRDTAAGFQWRGSTLAIHSGATMTELTLVTLSSKRQALTHQDFKIRSFAYAGNAIDQDIVCQLLLQPDSLKAELIPEGVELPLPGEPDLKRRYALQQCLEGSELGRTLLQAAQYLKQILQHQDYFTLKIGDRQWELRRKALEMQVFLPFLRRLNHELNALFSETGVSSQGVQQALCTGGTASMSAIARWLRQKLPSAAIIQDSYFTDRPPVCSRVAYGLATLPLFPQVLNLPRQQYSDYFLLLELIRAVPDEPLPMSDIMQRLERRGINTRACQRQIFAMLEGHLPLGLIPNETTLVLLTPATRQNLDYQALQSVPLFTKPEPKTYQIDRYQGNRICQYLSWVTKGRFQTLEEPYIVDLTL